MTETDKQKSNDNSTAGDVAADCATPAPEAEPAADTPAPEAAPAEDTPAPEAAPAEDTAPAPEADSEEPEGKAEAPAPDAREAAAAEIASLRDRILRLQADFDNYRKRQARERSEWIAQANSDLLEDILPALDQTDLALAAAQKDASDASKPFLDGFTLVRRTLLTSLARHGLKPVEGTVGKPLDTATSEAVTVMRTGQAKPGCVVYETRKGYTLNGKVLRAAQVVVEEEPEPASGTPADAPAPETAGAPAPEGDAPDAEAGAKSGEAAEG